MQTIALNPLTKREIEVLRLIEAGLSNKAIAKQLVLSPNTVAWHIQQIYSKLQVNRRTQAIRAARSLGILKQPTIRDVTSVNSKQPVQKRLPRQMTSFVGREVEIEQIESILSAEDCQLLTLVGHGGVGKTRLALEIAERQVDEFRHGVFFIALQPLTSPDELIPTIANTIGLKFQANDCKPIDQLHDYLHDKSALLVMDNFEHMIDSVHILCDLVTTSEVKILVTSREALNVREEFLYEIMGLKFPDTCETLTDSTYSAIELFKQRAVQIFPKFPIDDELPSVLRICQLVDGIPLALELAASWCKSLSCQEIERELQNGLEILSTQFRNVPKRHCSIQVVFDYSWQRLSEEHRTVFRRLSVFRGGFTRKAAAYVAGSNMHTLQALVDKSFIRRDPNLQRYEIHELMRQYGEQQLQLHPDEEQGVRNLHGAYYSDLLAESGEATRNEQQYVLMSTLDPEFDNLRVAWNWSIMQEDFESIQRSAQTLWVYLIFRSRFLEGLEAFEKAIKLCESRITTSQVMSLLAELQNLAGWLDIRLSRPSQAKTMFEKSADFYNQRENALPIGWVTEPLIGLTMVEIICGNYHAAEKLASQSVSMCSQKNHGMNLVLAHYVATGAAFHLGKYKLAQTHAEEALMLTKLTGELWVRAEILNDLGRISRELNDYTNARQHFAVSLDIRKMFGDAQGIAAALIHLGRLAILEEDYDNAQHLYYRSYSSYKEIGDKGGTGYALCGLGTIAYQLEDLSLAIHYYSQALQIASKIQYMPLIFSILVELGRVFLDIHKRQEGIRLLSFIYHHERSDQQAKDEAREILDNDAKNKGYERETNHVDRANCQEHDLNTLIRNLTEQLNECYKPVQKSEIASEFPHQL